MSVSVVDEYSDELNEGPRRIRTGCTIGRIINLCIALDFLLVLITALIVSGTLGAVNLAVSDRLCCYNMKLVKTMQGMDKIKN
jgi:hypothetical protein